MSEKNKIMLLYPPGKPYQRGEDRCQGNIQDSTATSMRACNDLGYSAAVLLQRNYEILLRDYQTEGKLRQDVLEDLHNFQPDLIMLSTTNATIFSDIELIAQCKSLSKAVVVFKGAIFYDASFEMLKLLNLNWIDYLIGGEAETCIGGIADYALRHQGNIAEVNNIFYKDEQEEWHKTSFHCWEEDLDSLPFPARQYMNNELYQRPDTKAAMATIQTSRGCSASCIYCLSPQISGKKIRLRSPANIFAEIEECYQKYQIRNFFFKADTFTMNAQWTQELCQLIIDSPLHGKINFTANSRTNPLQKETLQIMKEAGCFAVAFGFESGSDATLKLIHKGSTVALNLQAAQWAHEVGLPIYGFFMVGFPWETEEDLELLRQHIFTINADFIEIHLALPYYGTQLYKLCEEAGTLQDNILGMDYFHTSTRGTQFLTQQQLSEFRQKTLTSYYWRPTYIGKRFKECLTSPKKFLNYAKYGLKLLSK